MARKPPPLTPSPHWLPPALLFLTVLAVYYPVCGYEFSAYDDIQNIYLNELVTRLTPANLGYFWRQPFAGMYIPLTYNFWSLIAQLASFLPPGQTTALNPYVFHGANLLLHLGNVFLVFSLIRRLVKNEWSALLGALLFGLHPLQVEAVAWVTGGKDLLSGFFSLLALNCYLDYRQATEARLPRKRLYGLALLFFLAALLAKPGAVVLPLVAGVMGWGWLGKERRVLVRELAPWQLLAVPVAAVARLAQPEGRLEFIPHLGQRLLICGDTLSFYLLKLCAPFQLGFDYGRTPEAVLAGKWLWLSGLLPLLLLAGLFWRAPRPGRVAGGIFLLFLLPVLGLVPFSFQAISTVADRYLYLALLGPALAGGWFLGQSWNRWIWGASLALLALLGGKSLSQVAVWADPLTFNQNGLAVNPRSWTAYGNLGNAMAERNRGEEAVAYYRQGLALKPNDEKISLNLGLAYASLRQTAAATATFEETVRIVEADGHKNPEYKRELLRDAYANLGELAMGGGQGERAIAMFRKALALDPRARGINANLGVLLAERGQLVAAIACFQAALAENPHDLAARLNLEQARKRLPASPAGIRRPD